MRAVPLRVLIARRDEGRPTIGHCSAQEIIATAFFDSNGVVVVVVVVSTAAAAVPLLQCTYKRRSRPSLGTTILIEENSSRYCTYLSIA